MSDELNNEVARGQEDGQITYATEVISTIVSVATTEVEGISGIAGGGAISGIIGRGKAPRGVKVDVTEEHVTVDLALNIRYSFNIPEVSTKVQERVIAAIENMTGLKVLEVNVKIAGVNID